MKLTGSAVVWHSSSDCRGLEQTFCLDMFSISSGQRTSSNWWNLIGKKILNLKGFHCDLVVYFITCCHRYLGQYWTDLYLYIVLFSMPIPVILFARYECLPLMLLQAWLTGSMKWRQNRSTSRQLSTGTVVTQWSASSILSTLWIYKKKMFTFYELIMIKKISSLIMCNYI